MSLPPILSAPAWPTAPYAPGTAFVPSVYAPGTKIVPRYAWQSKIDSAAQSLDVQRIRAATHPSETPSVSLRSTVSSPRMGMRIQRGWQQFQASTPEDRRLAAEAMAPMEDEDEAAVDTEKEAAAAVKKTRIKAGLLIGAAIGLFLALR